MLKIARDFKNDLNLFNPKSIEPKYVISQMSSFEYIL